MNYLVFQSEGRPVRPMIDRDGKPAKAFVLATSPADARRLIAEVLGKGVVAAVAQDGETLLNHQGEAIKDGCAGRCVLKGWNDDGSPMWEWTDFPKPKTP